MNVYLNKFMVYFEIHRLSREGYSMRQISEELVINRRTVSKYLSLTEQGYELLLEQQSQRNKVLLPWIFRTILTPVPGILTPLKMGLVL